VLSFYRVALGLSVAFYIIPWIDAVSIGWAYGMMAIFEVLSFVSIAALLWKGHTIRKWSFAGLASSEDGMHWPRIRTNVCHCVMRNTP